MAQVRDNNFYGGTTSELGIGASMPVEGYSKDGKQVVQTPTYAPTVKENKWGIWIVGTGYFGSFNGTDDRSDFTTGEVTLGLDYRLTPHWLVGVLGSYAGTHGNFEHGDFDVQSGRGGLYTSWFGDRFYLNAAVLGGYSSYSTTRDSNSGATQGANFTGYIGTGYDFRKGNLTFGPAVSLQYDNIGIDGYQESGPQPLRFQDRSFNSLISRLGIRASYRTKIANVTVIPEFQVAWQHQYLNRGANITASFVDIPSQPITVSGVGADRDAVWGSVGINVLLSDHWSMYGSYSIEAGSDYHVHQVDLGLRCAF
jgi:outer membrane autotransporter protein